MKTDYQTETDDISLESLIKFVKYISNGWYGREHEAISLYIFAHLLPLIKKGTVLYDASQIGIEFTVPQTSTSHKKQVRKDLVIWRNPGENCWNYRKRPTRPPLAILEWKVFRGKPLIGNHPGDVAWLKGFTKIYRGIIGYTILVGILKERPNHIYFIIRNGSLLDTNRIGV